MNMRKHIAPLCVAIVVLCVVASLALPAKAHARDFMLTEPSNATEIKLSEGDNYDITESGSYKFSGQVTSTSSDGVADAAIRVHSGVTATIVLDNATILNSSDESISSADTSGANAIVAKGGNGSPLYIESGATVNLYLKGESTLRGWNRHYNDVNSTPNNGAGYSGGAAGIYLPDGATLIIGGNGTLNVTGGEGNNCINGSGGGAGIGTNGAYEHKSDVTSPATSGTLVIAGGTVAAQGGAPSGTPDISGGAGAGVGGGGGSAIGSSNGDAGSNGVVVVLAGTLSASSASTDDGVYESCLADPVGSGGPGRIPYGSEGNLEYVVGERGAAGTVSVANDATLAVSGGTGLALRKGTTTAPNPPGDEVPGSSFITIDAIGIYSSSTADFQRIIFKPTEHGWQACDDAAPVAGSTYAYVLYNAQDATYWGGAAAYEFESVEGATPVDTDPFTVYGTDLVFGSGSDADYWFENGILTIKTEKPVTISMSVPDSDVVWQQAIVVDPGEGRKAHVVLSDVRINLGLNFRGDGSAAFELRSGSLDLALSGSNYLRSPEGRAGLENGLNELTIAGTGSLEAEGGAYGAGIGGRKNTSGGSNIKILGGTITATGGDFAAGIGGGSAGSAYPDSGSNITIAGTANVTAYSGGGGAGIGVGVSGNDTCAGHDLVISGNAVVRAYGSRQASDWEAVGLGSMFGSYNRISISDAAVVEARGSDNGKNNAAGIWGSNVSISGGTVRVEAGGSHNWAINGGGACSISGGRIYAKGSLSYSFRSNITGGSFSSGVASAGLGSEGTVLGLKLDYITDGKSYCVVQTGDEDYPYEVRRSAEYYALSLTPSPSSVTVSYTGSAPDAGKLIDAPRYYTLLNGGDGEYGFIPADPSDLSFIYVDQSDRGATAHEGLPSEVGTYTITAALATKVDEDGMYYFGGSRTPFTLTIEPTATTTDLTLLNADGDKTSSFTYGDKITMRARVSASDSSVGEGTATFGYADSSDNFTVLAESVSATQQSDGSYVFEATYDTTGRGIPTGSGRTIRVLFNGSDGYEGSQADVTVALSPAQLSVSVSAVNSKTYDATTDATGVQLQLSGAKGSDAPTLAEGWKASWSSPNAGITTLDVTDLSLSDLWRGWYTCPSSLDDTPAPNGVSISKAELTVTAINRTVAFNGTLDLSSPQLGTDYTIFDFQGEDTASVVTGAPVLSCGYEKGVTSASSTLDISVGVSDMSANNYTFTGVSGTLTVIQSSSSMTASADKSEYTYGESITVSGSVTATGNAARSRTAPSAGQVALYYDDTQISDAVTLGADSSFSLSYETTDRVVPVGSQTLTVHYVATGDMAAVEQDVTVIIKKAELTPALGAVDAKTYDGTTEATDAQISLAAPVGSDAPTATGTVSWTSAAAGTTTLDVTDITLTDTWGDWYALSTDTLRGVTPGNDASISRAPLTVTPIAPTGLVFGDAAPASYAVDATGWVGSEGGQLSDDLAAALSFSTAYEQGAHADSYEVTVGWAGGSAPDALGNYEVSFSPATLIVGKAEVASIAAEYTTAKYTGEPIVAPAITAIDASGHESDGTVTLGWLDEAGSELPGAPTEVGSYTLRASIDEGTDHLGASRDIPFTVARADASTVTIGAVEGKTYDGTPVSTPSYEPGGYDGEVLLTWQASDGQGGWTDLAEGEEPVGAGMYRLLATAGQSATQEAPVIVNGEQVVVIAPAGQDAPEGLGATDESGPGAGDGSLTGLPAGSEWRPAGGEWTAAPEGGSVTGLAPGAYEVRLAADANHVASDSVLLSVRSFSAAHGGIEFPEGSSDDGNGMVVLPEGGGSITYPGGPSVTLPGGSVVNPDTGETSTPDGVVVTPGDGGTLVVTFPGGSTVTVPDGSALEGGAMTLPDGTVVRPGQGGGLVVALPDGTVIEAPSGSSVSGGRVFDADGSEVLPPAEEAGAEDCDKDASQASAEGLARTGEGFSPAAPLAALGVVALVGRRALRRRKAS